MNNQLHELDDLDELDEVYVAPNIVSNTVPCTVPHTVPNKPSNKKKNNAPLNINQLQDMSVEELQKVYNNIINGGKTPTSEVSPMRAKLREKLKNKKKLKN